MTFNNDATIAPTTYSAHHIEWNLGTLAVSQSTEIVFSARVTVFSSVKACNSATVTTSEGPQDTDTACIEVQPQGHLSCNMTVWNPTTQQWVEQINANIGNTVRFRVTMTYSGSGTLMNIKVKDVLPVCLQWADNANPVQTAVSGKNVYWNLSTTLTNGQSTSIEFDALVISAGTNVNLVNITGLENGCSPLYCQDTATVIVEQPPSLICDKKVWNPTTQQWVEQINANIGNTVRFRITMTYSGSGTLMNIKVKDVLPVCLQWADNANPVQTAVSGKNVYWNLSTTLTNGQSTEY